MHIAIHLLRVAIGDLTFRVLANRHAVKRKVDVRALAQVVIHVPVLPELVERHFARTLARVGERERLRIVEVARADRVLAHALRPRVLIVRAEPLLVHVVMDDVAVLVVLRKTEEVVFRRVFSAIGVDRDDYGARLVIGRRAHAHGTIGHGTISTHRRIMHVELVALVVEHRQLIVAHLHPNVAVGIGRERIRILGAREHDLCCRTRVLALVLPVLHNREVDEAQTAVRRGHGLHVLVVLRLSSFGRAHLVHVVWRGHALGALGPTDVHPLAIGGEVIVSARRLLAVNDRIMHLATVGIRADQVELDNLEVLIGEAADRHRVLGIPRLGGREDDRRGVHGLARLVGVARRPIGVDRFGLHVVQRHEVHCDGEAMLRVVAVVPVLDDADFGRLARTDPVVDPGGVGLGVIGAVGIPAVGRLCLQHEIAVTHAALVVLGQVLEVEMIGPRLLIRRPVKPLDRGGLGVRGAVQLKRADKTAVLEELHVRDARRVQIGMVLIGAVLRLDLRERTVRLLPVLVNVLLGHVLKGVRDGVRVRVERGSEGKLLVLALLVLEREGEGAAAVVVTLEARLLVAERDARLDPAVLELVTVRVVLGEGIAERLGEDLGLPAINVDRLVGVLPRIVRALDAALRGELDHHVVKRVLERGDFPSLGGLDLHGAGQAVRNGPVVVDEVVGCAVGRVEPRLAVLVRVVGIRVGDAAILAHGAVDGLVTCRGRLLAQGVDIGVAIRVILGQVVENALSRFAIFSSEERTEVDGALAILRNGDLHVANGAHRGPRLSLAGVSTADLVQLHLCGSRRTAVHRVAPKREGRSRTIGLIAVEPNLLGVVTRGAHGTQRHGPAIIERVDRAAVARRSRVIVCRLEVVRARPGIRILEIGVVDDRGAILGVAGQRRGDGRRLVILAKLDAERLALRVLPTAHILNRTEPGGSALVSHLLVVDKCAEAEVVGVILVIKGVAENLLESVLAELALDGELVGLREHEVALAIATFVGGRTTVVLAVGVAVRPRVGVVEAPGNILTLLGALSYQVAVLVVLRISVFIQVRRGRRSHQLGRQPAHREVPRTHAHDAGHRLPDPRGRFALGDMERIACRLREVAARIHQINPRTAIAKLELGDHAGSIRPHVGATARVVVAPGDAHSGAAGQLGIAVRNRLRAVPRQDIVERLARKIDDRIDIFLIRRSLSLAVRLVTSGLVLGEPQLLQQLGARGNFKRRGLGVLLALRVLLKGPGKLGCLVSHQARGHKYVQIDARMERREHRGLLGAVRRLGRGAHEVGLARLGILGRDEGNLERTVDHLGGRDADRGGLVVLVELEHIELRVGVDRRKVLGQRHGHGIARNDRSAGVLRVLGPLGGVELKLKVQLSAELIRQRALLDILRRVAVLGVGEDEARARKRERVEVTLPGARVDALLLLGGLLRIVGGLTVRVRAVI